jgi:hypothetical protein
MELGPTQLFNQQRLRLRDAAAAGGGAPAAGE